MGLIGSSARMNAIIARRNDLEVQTEQLNNTRTMYSMKAADSMQQYTDQLAALSGITSTGSTVTISGMTAPDQDTIDNYREVLTAQMNADQAKYGAVDKIYEQMLKKVDTEHKTLDTEYEAVSKVIEKSVERGYKTLA